MALPLLREAGKGGEPHAPHGTALPRGSALANLISQFSLALLLFLYIFWKKLHQATWGGKGCLLFSNSDMGFASGELQATPGCVVMVCPASGWSLECLQDWGSFFRLAIPSMLMLCMEWWAYEIGSFLSGQCGRGGTAGGGGGLAQKRGTSALSPQVSSAWWSWGPSPSCMNWPRLYSW